MVIFHSYVSLPEGIHGIHNQQSDIWVWIVWMNNSPNPCFLGFKSNFDHGFFGQSWFNWSWIRQFTQSPLPRSMLPPCIWASFKNLTEAWQPLHPGPMMSLDTLYHCCAPMVVGHLRFPRKVGVRQFHCTGSYIAPGDTPLI